MSLPILTVLFVCSLVIPDALSTLPGTFDYECAIGDNPSEVKITIDKSASKLSNVTFSFTKSTCQVNDSSTTVQLTNCPVDTNIALTVIGYEQDNVVRKTNEKVYTLHCKSNTSPYTVKVSAAVTVDPVTATNVQLNTQQIKYSTLSPSTFDMKIESQSNIIIGDQLTVTIKSADNVIYAPVNCTASSGSNSHELWSQTTCPADPNLFKGDWEIANDNKTLTHEMEAFRFTGSHDITLTCVLRICPSGRRADCPLSCTSRSGRRRRDTIEDTGTDDVVVRSTFTVSDSLYTFDASHGTSTTATYITVYAVSMFIAGIFY